LSRRRVIVGPAIRAPTHKPSTEEHLPCVLGKFFPHVLSASYRIGVDAGEFGLADIQRYKHTAWIFSETT
jgi:hypothetical protein